VLAGLLDDVGRAGNHWEGLGHPRLTLDVGLLRVRSTALVDNSLVRIIVASDDWYSLYTAGVLLWVGGCSVVRG